MGDTQSEKGTSATDSICTKNWGQLEVNRPPGSLSAILYKMTTFDTSVLYTKRFLSSEKGSTPNGKKLRSKASKLFSFEVHFSKGSNFVSVASLESDWVASDLSLHCLPRLVVPTKTVGNM